MDAVNIINNINAVAEKIFKSVEKDVFKNLDMLVNISPNILKEEPLNKIFTEDLNSNIILLISSFIILFAISYLISRVILLYNGEQQTSVFKFILRVSVCTIFSISSFYLVETLLNINSLFTSVIANIGEDITQEKICFNSLREVVIDLNQYMGEDFLSLDGMIKGVISFGAATLLLHFSIRYTTIIFLIVVSPIAIMFASSDITYDIFSNWLKMLLINLFIQNIVVLIIIIPLGFKNINTTMFKIVLVGVIYLLYRINNFAKEVLGNISRKVVRRR